MELYRSDKVGIALGAVLGIYQPFATVNASVFSTYTFNGLMFVALIGVVIPPLLALITKIIIPKHQPIQQKIGKYINTLFLIITYGFVTGIVGFLYHMIVGLPDHAVKLIVFFASGGLGFLLAYFINPEMAYRPKAGA